MRWWVCLRWRGGGLNARTDNLVSQILKFSLQIIKKIWDNAQELRIMALKRMLKKKKDDVETKNKLMKEKQQQKARRTKEAFIFYYHNTAHIEVVRNYQEEKRLENIYFIQLPYMKFLPKELRNQFNLSVDRSNLKSKVQDLVKCSDYFIQVCKHEEKLNIFFQKNQFLGIFAYNIKLWKNISFLLSVILNLFIITSYASIFGSRMDAPRLLMSNHVTVAKTKSIFSILGWMMVCSSSFILVFYMLKQLPIIYRKAWKQLKPGQFKKMRCHQKIAHLLLNCYRLYRQLTSEIELVYYLIYETFAVLGTLYHPFFFIFHLLEIVIKYPLLQNVTKSVYEPRFQLLLTYVLFIILTYIFTIIGYIYFHHDFKGECEDVMWCFLLITDYTFKVSRRSSRDHASTFAAAGARHRHTL